MTVRRVVVLVAACVVSALSVASEVQPFTPKDISGRWESPQPMLVDEANSLYGTFVFELDAKNWTHIFTGSADAKGQHKLFSYRVGSSPYALGKSVSSVQGALEGDFERSRFYMTAYSQSMADLFNKSKCGDGRWKIGVEQEVTAAGCAFIPSKSSCPRELDIVVFDGKTLSFGDRSGNMCQAPRPNKPSKAVFVRKPVYALIQAKVKNHAEFFESYVPGHMPSVVQYGGKIDRALKAERSVADPRLKGVLPGQLFIVQEWPSTLAFDAWWNSPEYAPWKKVRSKAADVQVTLSTSISQQ